MIRFSLVCEAGHDFESWFPSGDAYEAQRARGLLSCPICDSAKVEKALMAPALGRKGNRATSAMTAPAPPETPPSVEPVVPAPVALLSEKEQAMRAMIRAVREHVTQNAENVGRGFAHEARRMHYGETPHRSIWGEADAGEAKAMVEEGIEFHALPAAPEDRN